MISHTDVQAKVKELQTESLEHIAELMIEKERHIEALEQRIQDYGGEV